MILGYVAGSSCWEVLIATTAFEPPCACSFGLVGKASLASCACDAGAWECNHGGMELVDGLCFGADHAGNLVDMP